MSRVHCEVCRRYVTPIGPSRWWSLALLAGAIACAMVVGGAAMLGIGLLMAAPIAAILGIGIITPLARAAGQTPTCPRCGRYVDVLASARETTTASATKAKALAYTH